MIPAKIKQARSKTALRRIPPITDNLINKIVANGILEDMGFSKDADNGFNLHSKS